MQDTQTYAFRSGVSRGEKIRPLKNELFPGTSLRRLVMNALSATRSVDISRIPSKGGRFGHRYLSSTPTMRLLHACPTRFVAGQAHRAEIDDRGRAGDENGPPDRDGNPTSQYMSSLNSIFRFHFLIQQLDRLHQEETNPHQTETEKKGLKFCSSTRHNVESKM